MGIEIAFYNSMMKRQTWKYAQTNISLRASSDAFHYASLRLNGFLMLLLWVVTCMAVYGWVYNAHAAESGAQNPAMENPVEIAAKSPALFTEDECWENFTTAADIAFCLISAVKNKNNKGDKQKQKPTPDKRR